MVGQLPSVALFSILAGLGTLIGVYLILLWQSWVTRNSRYFISFAAGALLGAAMGSILPEALEFSRGSLPLLLVSFFAFYLLEHNMMLHAHHEERDTAHTMGMLAFWGLGFHSLLDGIAIGAGFEVGPSLGLVVALGVTAHKLADGISITTILFHARFPRRMVILRAWVVALATPLGAIVAYLVLRGISGEILGALLALAAGSFLYIAASDLIPETHRSSNWRTVVVVLGGAGLLLTLGMLLG